jgi:hypothetical protein
MPKPLHPIRTVSVRRKCKYLCLTSNNINDLAEKGDHILTPLRPLWHPLRLPYRKGRKLAWLHKWNGAKLDAPESHP